MSANASNSLSQYLEQLRGTTFQRLYQQPSTVFAIFRRMLPHLAKTIVMAILYMPAPFLLSDLEIWIKPSAKREKDQAISALRTLHIISRDTPHHITLSPNFRNSLRLALEGGGDHNSFGVPSTQPVPPEIDTAFLDKYARRKWDDILHFVVNSVGSGGGGRVSTGPKQSVKDLLLNGNLVEQKPGASVNITQEGFTFLLQEANAQVWTLLLLWLTAVDRANDHAKKKAGADSIGLEGPDMLSFFFLLSSLELGRAYSTDALTPARRDLLPNLADFGLIYIPHGNPSQFFPTRLATTLTSSETTLRSVSAGFAAAAAGAKNGSGSGSGSGDDSPAPGLADSQERNAIILETNFRLYAYIHSPLQIAVLALFSDLKFRFKGLVSGHLTRGSVRRAVDMGITADQIISYLATHAHEQMHRVSATNSKPLLPPVVVDQIRLWQLDTERMLTTTGYLFKDFDNYKDYLEICNFADDIGVVSWRNDKRGIFFANKTDQIKDFMKARKKVKAEEQGGAANGAS
ncbi:transcription factor tfb2-like protein [Microdochium bolleyi]|uniref:RNA polymerase II transcription factor B subunit 2 n=1 Tax=Microdochium bolleyi TaxID=196109 RepID=A0A136JJH9_9PEZI|nr:transcription factor tfb2-like protein [Microdochium bolleyi]